MSSENWVRLPVIDFSKQDLKPGTPEWDVLKVQVREALAEYGCFEASTDRLKEVGKPIIGALEEIFDLPLETKKLCVSEKNRFIGYYAPKAPMAESFAIDNVDEENNIQQSLTNILWPQGNPSFSKSQVCFAELALGLEKTIRAMILESFGLDDNYVKEHMDLTKYSVRLMKYEAQTQSNDDPLLVAHYDSNLLTLLYQNEVNGLEIQNNGEWIKVKFSPHSFIVMIGETLSALLNGRLPSVLHCVMNVENNKTRYSTGFFSCLKGGFKVKVPEEVVDEQHPLLFKPFDYDEFHACFISNVNPLGQAFRNLKTYCGV
ncbi:Oxoglutarate/iron-dependent dioxygenase [Corchorus olitorius]|uniref:Oxoglutarate/iron-dependent dioxygenase n=1 Tax=Corchorus olitorius TaxID=93759 RepID=A0A1R3JZC0_9ROSI|nr:Oxoglutarate/iron-dependent dioxygenase [Corchorus olitorius]